MTTSAHSAGLAELIESSVTRLTVVLGALKTVQTHEELLSPAVRAEILRSALRHGMELQALMDRAQSEAASAG